DTPASRQWQQKGVSRRIPNTATIFTIRTYAGGAFKRRFARMRSGTSQILSSAQLFQCRQRRLIVRFPPADRHILHMPNDAICIDHEHRAAFQTQVLDMRAVGVTKVHIVIVRAHDHSVDPLGATPARLCEGQVGANGQDVDLIAKRGGLLVEAAGGPPAERADGSGENTTSPPSVPAILAPR